MPNMHMQLPSVGVLLEPTIRCVRRLNAGPNYRLN